jgi:hypothetical protein
MRQPFVAAPGGHHREAATARPVHQVADQRRLVAEGQRIDHAGLLCPAREQRPTERVGLDRHVDHMLAVLEGRQAMVDRGNGVAGALDDDVDRRVPHQGLPVVADMRAAVLQCRVQARRHAALGLPADPREVAPGAVGAQVGNAGQMHARRARDL